METSSLNHYGYLRDSLDARDYIFTARPEVLRALPPQVDHRTTGFMPTGVYDQGQIGCHDGKTEVLTERGWVAWPAYNGADLLATVNQSTHELEFQQPLDIQAYEYTGLLHHSATRNNDFALTSNHRMYVRRWSEANRTLSSNYQFTQMERIGWYSGLLAAPSGVAGTDIQQVQIGRRIYSGDDFIKLLALITSDGWVAGTESNWNSISFCCFKDDLFFLTKVHLLARSLGIHMLPGRPGVWKWSDAELAHWLKANMYVAPIYKAPFKKVPDIVKTASSRQIELFLEFFGDKHNNQFYTSSVRLADDLQELLLRVGKRSSLLIYPPKTATMLDGRKVVGKYPAHVITALSDEVSIERKNGLYSDAVVKEPVYCATVPNSTLITRRNGYTLISGNSCTGNAWASAFDYVRAKQGLPPLGPSRLFIYYNERDLEGTANQDAGAQIRDGIKTLAAQGVCPESEWPYDVSKVLNKPPANDYTDALANQAIRYMSVQQTSDQIMGALADGYPIVIGFAVYQGFESLPSNSIVPLPGPSERPLGGHAQHLCGYDATLSRSHEVLVLTRNSWGPNWGQQGYAWFPMSYLTNTQLSADFWTLELVEAPTPIPPTPSPVFYVGPDVAKAMALNGDVPASNEWYPLDSNGKSVGFSMAKAQKGRTYMYTASDGVVAWFDPDGVFQGTSSPLA